MGTHSDRRRAEPEERFDIDVSRWATGEQQQTAAMDDAPIPTPEPPVEPPATGSPSTSDAQVLQRLIQFHVTGQTQERPSQARRLTPALLWGHDDLTAIRYDYPLCIASDGDATFVRPLSRIVDELIESIADESDAGRRLARHVFQIERALKTTVAGKSSSRLSEVWARAEEAVRSSADVTGDKAETLAQDLRTAREALRLDGEVIECDAESASRLFRAHRSIDRRIRYREWRAELDNLIRAARDILVADDSHSPEALDPKNLRATMGKKADDEVDLDVMSSIIGESDLGAPIPAARRRRIEQAVATLERFRSVFSEDEDADDAPIRTHVLDDCALARRELALRPRVMAEFFKAVRIARLEGANHYREDVHDPFFTAFDASSMTREEMSLCPPVLLELRAEALTEADLGPLLELIVSELPVKILVVVSDLFANAEAGDMRLAWPARLARMALGAGQACIAQTTVSRAEALVKALSAAFRFDGPALISVFCGSRSYQMGLSHYLASAAALEARLFPTIINDPGAGAQWADRIDISENPDVEATWPSGTFRFVKEGDEKCEETLEFTAVDYWLDDVRLASQFWAVPREMWHEAMVPAAAFDPDAGGDQVPYVTAVDEDNQVVRVVTTLSVLGAAWSVAAAWRDVQELGGVHSSFAARQVAKERERLEEEKRAEVDTIRKEYEAHLGRDIGRLTEEIVRRIASQLLSGGADAASAVMEKPPPAAAPAEAPQPLSEPPAEGAVTEAPETPEEEDDEISLDDPYIDTPLCTSCDECTRLNPQMFAYDDNKQAYIKDASAGPYRHLVEAAEKCPVHIIHPGKPKDASEPGLDGLVERAAKFG